MGDARPWLLLGVASHELGKACPGFQCKWENLTGMDTGRSPNTKINHAFVSQIALAEILQKDSWPDEEAGLEADAVGCHHGERASPSILDRLRDNRRPIGKVHWTEARYDLLNAPLELFKPVKLPTKQKLSGPDFMLLAGLVYPLFSD
jgi:CRISPR-associated endonuclease/helicase Cas3